MKVDTNEVFMDKAIKKILCASFVLLIFFGRGAGPLSAYDPYDDTNQGMPVFC